jgi:hypothetical protein
MARTKYTSTPTYGMQRRGFGKRQTETKQNPELDFTQKPTPDFDAPVSGVSDPYGIPQGIYHDPVPKQSGIPFQTYQVPTQSIDGNYGVPVQPMGMQGSYPMFAAGQGNPYGDTSQPFTGAPIPQMPPLANATPVAQPIGASARAQGYVPPKVVRAQQAAPSRMPQQNAVPLGMAYTGPSVPYGQPAFAMQPPSQPSVPTGAYPNYSGGNQPPTQPPGKQPRPPINIENWLKMLLYIILPVFFVVCIALRDEVFDILRYLFMTACAASVGMLWYRQSFSSSLRAGITIGYGMMCIVVIVIMLSGSNSDVVRSGENITAAPTAVITDEPSAEAYGYSADQAPVTTPPAETAPEDTDAGQRLASFMDNWKVNDIENMLGYVLPSWRQSQTDAAAALFILISNRTPLSYTIEDISGSTNDTSRSITMTAEIDKNNGNDPVKYRFLILMDKEDGDWYVDPNSLSTNDADPTDTPYPDDLEAIFTLAPRQTVTPVPPDNTLLYYNPSGGTYYHADPECEAVNSKYYPLSSFTYGELNEEPYKSLTPCLKCGAPSRPSD